MEKNEASQSSISSSKTENEISASGVKENSAISKFELEELLLKQKAAFKEDNKVLKLLLDNSKPAIYGLAVLEKEVFLLRLRSSIIEVYDLKTFDFKRKIEIRGLTNPENMASCHVNKCLYAFDWEFRGRSGEVLRWEPCNGNLLRNWKTLEGGGRLSVADDTNIILNINNRVKLHEYTPDGSLVRVINLASGTGITRSWHGVKLSSGFYVVCHGGYDNITNRVCLCYLKEDDGDNSHKYFDAVITKIYDGKEQNEPLLLPAYLSVSRTGSILVSDFENWMAVLLDSNLDNPQVILRKDDINDVFFPWRTCADDDNDRWIVAEYNEIVALQPKIQVVKQLKLGT